MGHGRRGDDDDGQVHRVGNRGDVGIATPAQDFVEVRVDGIDPALIAVRQQVVDHAVAQLPRGGRRADDGHPARLEKGREGFDIGR